MRIANFPSAAVTPSSTTSTPSTPAPKDLSTPASGSAGASARFKLDVSFSLQVDGFDAAKGSAGSIEDQVVDALVNEMVGLLCEDDASRDDMASSDSSAATGGLEKNPAGWPDGSVKTPGGYVVVPEKKDHAWSVYSPGQSPSDKPTSRVWGDPHVTEKDGTKWDFTKDSNFRLPDGTTISCDTTSEKGQSISKGLDIVAGSDRVSITGLDKNAPQTGDVGQVSPELRARMQGLQDTFSLGKDGDEVQWFRERNGQIEGLITGSKQDAEKTYDQVLDRNVKPPSPATQGQGVTPVGTTGAATAAATAAPLGSDDFAQQLMDELQKLLGGETTPGAQPSQAAPAVNTDATGDLEGVQELLQALKDLARLIERLGTVQRPTAIAG